jgi:transposase
LSKTPIGQLLTNFFTGFLFLFRIFLNAIKQLERVEQQVKEVLYKIPFAKKLLMIKGISEISLAGILGESGDLSGFSHGNSLLRHAGLHLAEASSGKWKGQIVISKRGCDCSIG